MAVEVFKRYEQKFLLDEVTFQRLEEKMLDYLELDAYNKSHVFYTISNIYFDTPDSFLIRKSLSKPVYKEKLRLRAYGVPDKYDTVFLEIKKKFDGLVNKRRAALKLDEAHRFLNTGQLPSYGGYIQRQVLNEIAFLMKRYPLEPKLYLAYDRRAYFSKDDPNLRITFDSRIRTRRFDLKLESGDYGGDLLQKGQLLMEVKTADTVPFWLTRMLSELKIYKTSFSKYGREYQDLLINDKETKGEIKICSKPYSAEPRLQAQYQF